MASFQFRPVAAARLDSFVASPPHLFQLRVTTPNLAVARLVFSPEGLQPTAEKLVGADDWRCEDAVQPAACTGRCAYEADGSGGGWCYDPTEASSCSPAADATACPFPPAGRCCFRRRLCGTSAWRLPRQPASRPPSVAGCRSDPPRQGGGGRRRR